MKKTLLTVVQIAVTLFALYWVFRKPEDRASMMVAMRQAQVGWLLLALAAGAISPFAATLRWGLLLRVQGINLGWMRVTQLYMIGTFFNLFLLGSTGGDAIKMFYLLRQVEPGKRAGGVMSVAIDRVLGLLALIILATVFVVVRYRWLTQTPRAAALLASFALILGGAAMGMLVTVTIVGFRLADKLPAGMPGRAKILEAAVACESYGRSWRVILQGILISSLGHSSFFVTYYCAARALRATISFWDMTVILPIVNTIIALPISVSGVGVRENLFVTLLQDLCGIGKGQAVPISIVGFVCTVIFYGLLGGVFYLFYRSSAGAPPPPAHPEALEEQVLEGIVHDRIEGEA
jgi:uncharacterized membrane protein YbhN (UPF0104 family)